MTDMIEAYRAKNEAIVALRVAQATYKRLKAEYEALAPFQPGDLVEVHGKKGYIREIVDTDVCASFRYNIGKLTPSGEPSSTAKLIAKDVYSKWITKL